MRCPSLSEIPPPPRGRVGWPWTEESMRLPERMPDGKPWPRITIVTPSFNQGRFIEETIRSILLQGYPNLEYFVLDGASTDSSVAIIKKYASWIDFWVSEPDRGQSAAINRGLRMGSGAYATWINSDDMLCKNALSTHFLTQQRSPDVVYLGDCLNIDETGKTMLTHRGRVRSLEDLARIGSVWRSGGYICQQEVLFPLELAVRVGGLNEENHYSMDYELWGEFLLAGAQFEYTGIPFGFFRWHKAQKTQENIKQTESMLGAAKAMTVRAGFLSAETKEEILTDLDAYWDVYQRRSWKQSGRLTRIGLPRSVVIPIRSLRHTVEKTIGSLMRCSK
jgi:glycosyltransferase involved in cell wall biosynthesis